MKVDPNATPSEQAYQLIREIEHLQAEGSRQKVHDLVSTYLNDFYQEAYDEGRVDGYHDGFWAGG